MDFADLECHFTWHPDKDDKEKRLEKVLDHSKVDEPDVDLLSLPLKAYLHCYTSPRKCDTALSIIDDFLLQCKNLKSQTHFADCAAGYETVGLSNKAFVLKQMGRTGEAQKMLKDIAKVDNLSDQSKAAVFGIHAYALGLFGTTKYSKGLELYTKAKKLDKNNYMWHFGTAFLAGRIRRVEEGTHTQPTEMEEGSLRVACELSKWALPVPIAFLAEIIFARGRDFTGHKHNEDKKALEEAKHFYKMAYELGGNSSTVLKKSGKGFSMLDEEDLGEECLLKAIKLDPYSSQAHHKLGQIYEFGSKKKNLKLAEFHYSKAVTAGRRRNFFAECDLCRAKKKNDVTYNTIRHYENMKKHYEFDEKRINMLNTKIKAINDYNENKKKTKLQQNRRPPRRY